MVFLRASLPAPTVAILQFPTSPCGRRSPPRKALESKMATPAPGMPCAPMASCGGADSP